MILPHHGFLWIEIVASGTRIRDAPLDAQSEQSVLKKKRDQSEKPPLDDLSEL